MPKISPRQQEMLKCLIWPIRSVAMHLPIKVRLKVIHAGLPGASCRSAPVKVAACRARGIAGCLDRRDRHGILKKHRQFPSSVFPGSGRIQSILERIHIIQFEWIMEMNIRHERMQRSLGLRCTDQRCDRSASLKEDGQCSSRIGAAPIVPQSAQPGDFWPHLSVSCCH